MRHGRVGSWDLEFAGVCAAVETETHLKLPLPITVLCDCVDFLFVMCKMRLKKNVFAYLLLTSGDGGSTPISKLPFSVK
jgi:hypothetical protein